MLQKTVPVLPSVNIRESIDFYESKLGFAGRNYGTYGILKYEGAEIHLVMTADTPAGTIPACVILVDNIEDLYTLFTSRGLLQLKGKLKDLPWGMKEFTITDNNNNLIRFAEKR